jgi:hypothetical protein
MRVTDKDVISKAAAMADARRGSGDPPSGTASQYIWQ